MDKRRSCSGYPEIGNRATDRGCVGDPIRRSCFKIRIFGRDQDEAEDQPEDLLKHVEDLRRGLNIDIGRKDLFEMASKSQAAVIKEHYENLLAKYYSWMSGGFSLKIEENRNFFKDRHIRPCLSKVAVDLGAGPGFQSIPLAEIGFRIIAVDLSRTLLAELEENARDLSIKIINDDLLTFSTHCPAPVELVVCMGDTMTHLAAHQDIRHLLKRIYSALEVGGRVILTFRDLTVELKGLDRFIPVRSDGNTIFTCFLEYEKDHVTVHDIVYERKNNRWEQRKSAYKKIRIFPQWTKDILKDIGFKIEAYDTHNAEVCIIAQKIFE